MGDFDWGSVFGTFGGGASDFDTSSLGDSDWGSFLGTNDTDWSSFLNGGSGSGSSASGWGNFFKSLMGGSDNSSGLGTNIFSALLGGIGGAADAKLQIKMAQDLARIRGEEDRKTLGYSADLKDYYDQKNKYRKKVALDTYGQFSLLDRWAPNYTPPAPIDQPAKPTAQGAY
jgi:hypothetical protein